MSAIKQELLTYHRLLFPASHVCLQIRCRSRLLQWGFFDTFAFNENENTKEFKFCAKFNCRPTFIMKQSTYWNTLKSSIFFTQVWKYILFSKEQGAHPQGPFILEHFPFISFSLHLLMKLLIWNSVPAVSRIWNILDNASVLSLSWIYSCQYQFLV